MDAVRTGVSALAHHDRMPGTIRPRRRGARRCTADGPDRHAGGDAGKTGRGGRADDAGSGAGHAANFLYLLTGDRPGALAARAFDVGLILHADHELNASTFAARVAAATLTDLHSTIVAGVAALKGPLHGGANAAVMRMLTAVGDDADDRRVEDVIRGMLADKRRVPGFGHRVYRTEDPRATHLRRMSRDLGEQTGRPRWFAISERIEKLMKAETGIDANVDFYSASTYHVLGIPIDLFTPIFVVSRVAGWTAHVLEQYANNRLIRPRAEYVGPEYPQAFVPLADRQAPPAQAFAPGNGGRRETGADSRWEAPTP